MQTTSATWKALLQAGARLETRATIAGTVYTQMSNPVVTRALTQGGMSIGNAVSASMQLAVVAPTSIPRAAEVALEMRLTDGTTASEWLPAGTYYIAKRKRDPINGILSLTCYDALLKANGPANRMPWATQGGNVMTTQGGEWLYFEGNWVRPSEKVAADIALILGVDIDPRTQIRTGDAYVVDNSAGGMTLRDALGIIAAQNAGNWIISPAGKLRLVPLVSASGAGDATQDVVDVLAITQSIDASAAGTVTGIRYGTGDEAVILGNDAGIVIDANVGAAVASDLYDTLVGYTYQPYMLTGAIYDPAAELGDYVRAGANGEITSALYSETAIYSAMFNGGISAPEAGEMDDEYPYICASAKALMASKVYTAQAVEKLDESLNQESVFNRLTDNGAAQGIYLADGKLYVNATYIQTGYLSFDRAKGGTLTLGGLNNTDGVMRVLDASGNEIGKWDKDGITLYKGAIQGPSVVLGGANNANGTLTVKDAAGDPIGTWDQSGITINKGAIAGPSIVLGGANNVNGVLSVKDTYGNIVGTWSEDGIILKDNAGNEIGRWDETGMKLSINGNGDNYAQFNSNGMLLMLENGSYVKTGQIQVSGGLYPSVPVGMLSVEYGDYTTDLWPGGFMFSYDYPTYYLRYNLASLEIQGDDYGCTINVGTGRFSFGGGGKQISFDCNPNNTEFRVGYYYGEYQQTGYEISFNFDTGECRIHGDLTVTGDVSAGNGAPGTYTFTTADGKTVTVTNGIITSIVGNAPQALTLAYHQI